MQAIKIGNVEIVALVDTIEAYPFSVVYPKAELLDWHREYLDDDNNVALNFGAYVVREGETTLLVDTGWGPEHHGRLLEELAAASIMPGAVTHVLFTHLHGDHTGWNIDRGTRKSLSDELEDRVDFYMQNLGVDGSQEMVKEKTKIVDVHPPIPEALKGVL